jgi:hypothetical protein
MAQLESDSKFLAGKGVMDYSLLLGIHNRKFDIPSYLASPRDRCATVPVFVLTFLKFISLRLCVLGKLNISVPARQATRGDRLE